MYHANCECGQQIDVKLVQAGTIVSCPNCGSDVTVPNTLKLQALAGERHPHFSPLQRVAVALHEKTAPFDGSCQRCHNYEAHHEVPVHFEFLVERFLSDEDGFGFGTGGLTLRASSGEEHWGRFEFPLMFCEQCYAEFTADRKKARRRSLVWSLVSGLLMAPLILFTVLFALILPLVSGGAIILVLVMAARYRGRKKVDPYTLCVLEQLPLVGEAIHGEDEYRVRLGRGQPIAG